MVIKRIDPDKAHDLLQSDQGFTYLDVRMPEEFVEGHVPDSRNIPVMIRGEGGVGLRMNPEFSEVVDQEFKADSKISRLALP